MWLYLCVNIIVTTLLWPYVYELENGVAYDNSEVFVASDRKYVTSGDKFKFYWEQVVT